MAGGGAGVAVDGVVDELLVPAETGREVSHCCGSVVWHFDRVDDGSGRQQDPDGPLDFVEIVTVDDPVDELGGEGLGLGNRCLEGIPLAGEEEVGWVLAGG